MARRSQGSRPQHETLEAPLSCSASNEVACDEEEPGDQRWTSIFKRNNLAHRASVLSKTPAGLEAIVYHLSIPFYNTYTGPPEKNALYMNQNKFLPNALFFCPKN